MLLNLRGFLKDAFVNVAGQIKFQSFKTWNQEGVQHFELRLKVGGLLDGTQSTGLRLHLCYTKQSGFRLIDIHELDHPAGTIDFGKVRKP